MILILILIISILLNFTMGYIIYNLLRQNKFMNNFIIHDREYIIKLSDTIKSIDERINQINSKGTFDSDDEVGFFFNEIKLMKEQLNKFKI